jgi:hypothetical protein
MTTKAKKTQRRRPTKQRKARTPKAKRKLRKKLAARKPTKRGGAVRPLKNQRAMLRRSAATWQAEQRAVDRATITWSWVRILRALVTFNGEASGKQLAEASGVAQRGIYILLPRMSAAGLIAHKDSGPWVMTPLGQATLTTHARIVELALELAAASQPPKRAKR